MFLSDYPRIPTILTIITVFDDRLKNGSNLEFTYLKGRKTVELRTVITE